MTDVAPRPASTRGRGSGRGGRGGSRGGVRQRDRHTNGDHTKESTAFDDIADHGELGEMKKQYSSQLSTLRELFSDWTDVDLLFALQETDGDLDRTIEHITEGHVSQFADVKKTKDRAKPKPKDQHTTDSSNTSRPGRGRGGFDSARGGRGRSERGRGGFRGGRGDRGANGVRAAQAAMSTPTADVQDWGATPAETAGKTSWDTAETDGTSTGQWGNVVASKATPAAASEGAKSTLVPEGAPKKTWAQMFAKPAPAPAPPKPAAQPVPVEPTPPPEPVEEAIVVPEQEEIPPVTDETPTEESFEIIQPPIINIEETPVELTPSKDQLTEDNVEHLPDATVHPPPTGTAASTVDSGSRGPDSATPSVIAQSTQQPPIARPPMGGFATTAFKATAPSGRSASFTRKIFEQQEAVVLPGNHAVDRVGVQFGQMGLNGDVEDVDEEREEAETRPQPPQHSPPSQPRASLPPAPKQAAVAAEAPQEPYTTPKPAPGLPPAPQSQQSPANPIAPQTSLQQGTQPDQPFNQFGRYGQFGSQQDSLTSPQKPSDPFGQQQSQSSPFGGFSQAPGQTQQTQSQMGAFSSAPNDYSSYYTSDQQRNAYQNYYGSYGQQSTAGQQGAGASQQRTGSAFEAATGDSGFPTSQVQQAQARYGDTQQHSGHTTPNPTIGGQQQTSSQSQHTQQMHQQPHGQGQHGAGYPYGAGAHAYYNRGMDPYYAAYMNQFGYNQGGFGGGFNKGGMYGGPHHGYGMNPQSGYDQHSSSPANAGGFGQSSLHGRDTGFGSGLGDYSRSGSTQPTQQTSGASAFGGMGDMFGGRSGSGFPGQQQQYGQQQSGVQGTSAEDTLKPFGDSKSTAGPSPGGLGQPGRPGSATNTTGQGAGSGLPPQQSQQHGFGGYGSHMNQMQGGQASQYGGLGGLGGHGGQQHQGAGYGGYGAGFGSQYSYGRGGGWGGNYGH